MARDAGRWAADPAASAACSIGKIDAAIDSKFASTRQVLDADGHRLSGRRNAPVPGAPTLATSSLWRMARDRWVDVS